MFDVVDHLDELRCWPTDRLEARRREVVRAKRRLEVEELNIMRVLDERGRIRRHISVFVNGERGDEATPARPGDRIEVVPAITGG